MALLWTVLEIMTMFMYWNLPSLKTEEESSKQKLDSVLAVETTGTDYSQVPTCHQRAMNASLGAGPHAPDLESSQRSQLSTSHSSHFLTITARRTRIWNRYGTSADNSPLEQSTDTLCDRQNYATLPQDAAADDQLTQSNIFPSTDSEFTNSSKASPETVDAGESKVNSHPEQSNGYQSLEDSAGENRAPVTKITLNFFINGNAQFQILIDDDSMKHFFLLHRISS